MTSFPPWPRRWLPVLVLLWLVWFLTNYLLIRHFTIPVFDRFQYLGPASVGGLPWQLSLPMLRGFHGFDHAWGLQFIGSVILQKILLGAVPWSAALQTVTGLLLSSAAGYLLARLVWQQTRSPWAAVFAALLYLGNATTVVMTPHGRPEVWCHLGLLLLVPPLASFLAAQPLTRAQAWLAALACLILPTVHPVTLGLTGGLLVFAMLARPSSPRLPTAWLASAAAGVGLCALYLSTHPAAWRHFTINIPLQQSFNTSHWSFLLHPQQRLWAEHLYWLLAFAQILLLLPLARPARRRTLALPEARLLIGALIILGTLGYAWWFKVENSTHTAVAFPFVVLLAVILLHRWLTPARLPRPAIVLGATTLLSWYLLSFPVRLWRWSRAGFISAPAEWSAFLQQLPPAHMTYLPVRLWETAWARADRARYQFGTIPFPYPDKPRRAYEAETLAQAQPGDLLIIDLQDFTLSQFKGVFLMPVDPPDPTQWEFFQTNERLFAGSRPWGWIFRVYRHR